MTHYRWLLPAALALVLLGCGRPPQDRVMVLAAASTRDALQELADAFHGEHGVEVELSPEDSSRLATQIVNGAPADLFLSANEKWAEYVKDKGFAAEVQPLLGNTLVLVVPKGNPARVAGPGNLVSPAVRHVAVAGPTVPAGIYAREALTHLQLWEKLDAAGKVVSGDNVRTTLAFVERGEAQAGVVYGSDVRVAKDVEKSFDFPKSTHAPIRYPLVLLKRGADRPPARRFYEFLRSAKAAEVFQKYGFTWLSPE
jgi:molybdate transport system substrate-binding protein